MSGLVYVISAELTLRSSCFATTGDAFASRAGNQGFLAIGLKYKTQFSTRYYISNLIESAFEFYQRIRGAKSKAFPVVPQGATICASALRGVENKVHYVRDVTQGEDKSRIRTKPLPQILAIARNLALNLYRDAGFGNMSQAQRKCQFSLKQVASLFRMK